MSIEPGSDYVIPEETKARTLSLSATGPAGDTVIVIDSNGLMQVSAMPATNQYSVVETVQTRSVPRFGETPPAVLSAGQAFGVNKSGRLTVVALAASPPQARAAEGEMPVATPVS